MYLMGVVAIQILIITFAYLLGSINSAVPTCRIMGLLDPRASGSGNPGATNVLRTGNKLAAAVTLCGDVLKGVIATLSAGYLTAGVGWRIDHSEHLVAVAGLAAVLGHIYPVYYKFQGGKGVATTFGVLLGLQWPLGVLWAVVWVITALLFRYSALAALAATSVMLACAWFVFVDVWTVGILAVITALIFWRHRVNIRDLLAGNETKIW